MIPKIIHYCWLGNGPMPELVQRCVASWHRYMPDWQYTCWNEDTISQVLGSQWLERMPIYVQEAYAAKKYAFVSDYVRLWALEQDGGVYMDTDVEVLQPLDALLDDVAFVGFEESLAHLPGTCVMGTIASGEWVTAMLHVYDGIFFRSADGRYDLTTNVQRLGKRMVEMGLQRNGQEQWLTDKQGKSIVHVYPFDYFSPLTSTRVLRVSERTYTIHHFAGSWQQMKGWNKVKCFIADKIIGRECMNRLVHLKRRICNDRL